MNQIDVYYRALLNYRAETVANRDCVKLNHGFANPENGTDVIKVSRLRCTIDEEWVRKIEEGLVHIEKAIREERQFIRSNGEVVPIEKVKNVSRESVEHLARHSNLLTKKPADGGNIIPDQLYTVERLNDYAVYENRFLYMLLCYLRDFITLRYNKILELTTKYEGEIKIDKEITVGKQKLNYSVYLRDERRDDAYLREHNEAKTIIDRISLILKTVLAFIATPLMEYSAKVPMLKPPITKTNVLKMNNNFKGAVALYDYIISYDKQGFSVETIENEISPLQDKVAEEVAEAGIMLSFLTYQYGLGIENELREAYDAEELIRRTEEIKRRQEQIELLKSRVARNEMSVEEYALELERQVKLLARDNERIEPLEKEVEELRELEASLRGQISNLQANLDETRAAMAEMERMYLARIAKMEEDHAAEIAKMKRDHEVEIIALKDAHRAEVEKMRQDHAEEICELNEKYLAQINAIHEKYTAEIDALNTRYTAEIAELNEKYLAQINEMQESHNARIDELTEEHENELADLKSEHELAVNEMKYDHERKVEEINEELDKLTEDHLYAMERVSDELDDTREQLADTRAKLEALTESKMITDAQLKAARSAAGLMTADDDYTDKDSFNALEREHDAYLKFYNKQWNLTKKKMRKSMLTIDNFKNRKGQDE